MTVRQAKLVAESFTRLEPRLSELGEAMYARLFEIDPETRILFHGDMSTQQKKLMTLLGEFVRLQQRSQHFMPITSRGGQAVIPGISGLSSRHDSYGVLPRHYRSMRVALLEALAMILGDTFDDETRDAWAVTFDVMAEAMLSPERSEGTEARSLSSMFGSRLG